MNKVKKDEYSSCWLWTMELDLCGYGRFTSKDKKSGLAHRASYRLFKGPITPGKLIIHSCNTPGCVNPDHLREGTNAENTMDKIISKRCNPPKGEASHFAKLRGSDILAIREFHKNGRSYASIAKEYNINAESISNICRFKTWKHI